MWRELSRAALLLWIAWALAEIAVISVQPDVPEMSANASEPSAAAATEQAPATPPPPSTRVLDAQKLTPDSATAARQEALSERPLPQMLPSLAPLVERVRPTVVEVMTRGERGFWDRLMGMLDDGPRTIGSGVLIAPDGTILTNNHVIEGAERILVRLADGRERQARLIGRDPETDVALIQLVELDETITFAELGASKSLRVGDFVVAIGNPFGLQLTVTYGIISGTARELGENPFDSYLQTDAAINPGNSGGPLFNLEGRVVGINTAIVDQADGIGFAVPSDLIRTLLPVLVEHGEIRRGFLGASARNLLEEEMRATNLSEAEGACIRSIHRNGPAEAAGLKTGDIVIDIEGEPIQSASHLIRQISQFTPGQNIRLKVLRDGIEQEISVVLGERPKR
ncbi:MAG: trypsin-like peptidase domain-containing protein [Myxococcales bacterium]|jgi:serine protease Do|nr:trypsin-like peptidase domain-containing protein [Myxococcales bacterium]